MSKTLDDRIVDVSRNDDRRDSYRMPQPGSEFGTAKLRIGKKTVTVYVIDESAGGFMVAAEKIPKTQANKPVELLNASGRHPLRVVWRRTVRGQTRMGLQRLPEELIWRQESSWFVWMLFAVILGFGVGYVFAFRDQDDLAKRIVELSTRRILVNETVDDRPEKSPAADN